MTFCQQVPYPIFCSHSLIAEAEAFLRGTSIGGAGGFRNSKNPHAHCLQNSSLPKRKKALSKIVKPGKEAHSHQHRGVLLNRNGLPGQQHPHRRLGNAISNEIARRDIDGEPDHLPPRPLLVLEGKIFVQEKAQDTAQNIVRRRGDPVGAARQIIERKHDGCPKESVNDTDNQKF